MVWNWQQPDWPHFIYDFAQLEHLERDYAHALGAVTGTMKHLTKADKDEIVINILSTEGVKTAEIEGEILNRDSVQASIRKKLGLSATARSVKPAEAGIAELMMAVYRNYAAPLTHKELHRWNEDIMQGRTDLEKKGAYRAHVDAMQIVSGGLGQEKIHLEAPPSKQVSTEMKQFVHWFNGPSTKLPPLIRAGLVHLYSVSVHPYEDGNGRMARALAEKVLSQAAKAPALSGLARQIAANKPAYYAALEQNNQALEVTDWLLYFAKTVLEAKQYTLVSVERVLQKMRFYKQFEAELNARQIKVIDRLYASEPEGFLGGLSAKNYLAITKTSRATATRDLNQLVKLGILVKSGSRRYARYSLP